MKKKNLLLLITIVMAMSLLTMAVAAAETTVYVGGQAMTASTEGVQSYYTNGGTVSATDPGAYNAKLYYDENSVLILEINDLNTIGSADVTASYGAGIYSPASLTINVNGTNTVTGVPYSSNGYGIRTGGLEINGSGTLTVTNQDVSGNNYGIYSGGNVVINGADTDITAGETINIGSGWSQDSIGVYVTGSMTVNGGTLKTTASKSVNESSGIYTSADFILNGGTVVSTGGTAEANGGAQPAYSYGINARGNIIVNDGDLSAYGGGEYTGDDNRDTMTQTQSHGMYSHKNTEIYGGRVFAQGGDCEEDQSRGMYSYVSLIIAGGYVEAHGGYSHFDYSQGIVNYDGAEISGGTVVAYGGEGVVAGGLYCDWGLQISGDANITANSGKGDTRMYGTYVYGDFHMSGNASLKTYADGQRAENFTIASDETYAHRSIGLYMSPGSGSSADSNNPTYSTNTFTITGGTFEASCIENPWTVTTPTVAENCAVKFYDVIDNMFTFSDTVQTNAQWYRWTLDANNDAANMNKSTDKAYVHADDDANYASTYLLIEPIPVTHEVTFDSMGGTDVTPNPVEVDHEATVAEPADPTKAGGFTFMGWYTSEDGGVTLSATPYDFDTPVTENFTLYAKWEIVAEFNTMADAGYYSETRDSDEKDGVISLNVFIANFTDIKGIIVEYGLYVTSDKQNSQEVIVSSNDVDQLEGGSGYYHVIVMNITPDEFGVVFSGTPFVKVDTDGDLLTTADQIELKASAQVSTSVTAINKWLGSDNEYK